MCNRYIVKGSAREMTEHFRATLLTGFDPPEKDVLPGYLAPGLLLNRDGERELVPMQFGLAKPGADEPFDRKWPNNNARIEKHDKWPWKIANSSILSLYALVTYVSRSTAAEHSPPEFVGEVWFR